MCGMSYVWDGICVGCHICVNVRFNVCDDADPILNLMRLFICHHVIAEPRISGHTEPRTHTYVIILLAVYKLLSIHIVC